MLKKMSENKKERYLYEEREAAIHDEVTRVEESYEKGQVDIVKHMKERGMCDEDIAKMTGLDIEVVRAVKK